VYHEVAAQPSFLTVYVAEAHAHVQRLISVIKMATVLEDFTTEEQRSVVRFLWAKGLNAKDICFLLLVGSVCGVKRFTFRWQTFR
jgi:hypothetical protein